ncbi:MAG TPA: replicative DNA helicase [Anaerohalosphaeraceae bacterium]|nr:replicative DNA helicase [Anaerohalosphaeraceae bacterium]HOL31000.1 replicative DNA helicase [Anaerohalosphaeraceae bacterium]HOM76102.1 replicative DNA helicase [Anaerohalosphaeraceae bacterium]HPC63355.1 replicative DNA helicase [Anaerohalosphaeraceae bacterium]HPO69092.1 replicative DNA helicase [Anaerohalosphaeraceae bacterium]
MTQIKKKQIPRNDSWTDADLQQLLQGRKIPASPEAEAAVLGSMLLDRQAIADVIETIGADAFFLTEHRLIFEAIVSLYEKNSEIDLLLLRDELKKRNCLEAVGGVEYLVRVAETVPSAANVAYYTGIVQEKALLRQLAYVCGEILNEACREEGEASEKLDSAEQRVFAVTEKKIRGTAYPVRDLITETFENIEKRKGSHVTGLPTGFEELNYLLAGLQKGEMIIIAGRPSMGKTSFALNMAEALGADEGIPVAIFSMEMSRHQLVERFLCSRSGIDSQLVRKGMLSTDQMAELMRVGGELYEKPIFIDDTPNLNPLVVRAKCRRLKSRYDIQAVFIDYMQLMSLGGYVESRQQEISTISRQLKGLARELDVPVVVLSQLNRGAEGREGHRPRMSDLRESGSIEQDADVIMLLHREAYYHQGDEEWMSANQDKLNLAEVIVAKQRNGPTGTVELIFDGRLTRFKPKSHITEPF